MSAVRFYLANRRLYAVMAASPDLHGVNQFMESFAIDSLWRPFVSEDGGFTVDLPMAPVFTPQQVDYQGTTLDWWHYLGYNLYAPADRYGFAYADLPDGLAFDNADALLKDVATLVLTELSAPNLAAEGMSISVNGMPGREYSLTKPSGQRIVKQPGSVSQFFSGAVGRSLKKRLPAGGAKHLAKNDWKSHVNSLPDASPLQLAQSILSNHYPIPMNPINPWKFVATLVTAGTAVSLGLPAVATTTPFPQGSSAQGIEVAGLFRAIDIAEDVDDVLDGDIGQVAPIRNVTEDVGDALDDVNDTIYDVTHINLYEPFTDIDDTVEDFADDVDDTFRHVSNDGNDWFDW